MNQTWSLVLGHLAGFVAIIMAPVIWITLAVRYKSPPGPQQYVALCVIAVAAGALFLLPAVAIVGVAVLLALGYARLTAHYALSSLSYDRTLTPPRLFPDDQAVLVTRLRNDKLLPLTWISIEDPVWLGVVKDRHESDDPLSFEDGAIIRENADPVLVNHGAVGSFQELVCTYRVTALRRGVYTLGPARIESGDPFGFFQRIGTLGRRQEIVVYPRLHRPDEVDFSFHKVMGELATRRALHEDPMLLAGSREYRPGDPLNRVEWKATARSGNLQVRVYDSSTTAQLMLVLNVKTFQYFWQGIDVAGMEEAIRMTASLATWALNEGYAVGLHTNGTLSGASDDYDAQRIPPSANPRQATAVLEQLARLSFAGRFSAEQVLRDEAQRLRQGASILFVTSIMTADIGAALTSRQLAGRVAVVYCGSGPVLTLRGVPVYYVSSPWRDSRAGS